MAAVLVALTTLSVIFFAGLLLITPSVGDAPARAQALARAHHAPYPGPPVPRRFIAALVAAEDHRFYSEPGLDPWASARVILGKVIGQPDQGGATLYQQLARMLYTPDPSAVTAEAEQIVLGVKLAFAWPRTETLQLYADVVYFGQHLYGIFQASCGYFGVPPAMLSWSQATLLAGIVQAPSADNPITHFAAARTRQGHVLDRLVATGMLTRARAMRAYHQPLHLRHGQHVRCQTG